MRFRAVIAWARARLGPAVVVSLFLVWLVGQVVRDRFWVTGLCFYVPSPLAAGLLAAFALGAWLRSARRRALAAGLLAAGPAVFVGCVENQWAQVPPGPEDGPSLRLVHWNVFHGGGGWANVRDALADARPDVCVLSEASSGQPLEALQAGLGEGFTSTRMGGMGVLARGRVSVEPRPVASDQAEAFLVRWHGGTREVTLLAVDLPSSIGLARDPLLRQVRALIDGDRPDFVVGDFNAPRRSLALADLPEGYGHAYDRAGAGWSYTWPVPVPLWAIDQCLVGPRIRPLRYELRTTLVSDHRLQCLDFILDQGRDRQGAARTAP